MEEMIFDEAFMQQLDRLQMAIALRLHEGMQGGRRSSAKGASLEFSDFREYEPGDDFRRIDWTAYGRLDKLFVKVFMEEKEAIFNLFIDTSKSMSFGVPTKGKTSLQIAAALSYIIMARQDRVNIRLLGAESRTFPMDGEDKKSRTVPENGVGQESRTVPVDGESQEGKTVPIDETSQKERTVSMETKITPRAGKGGFHQLLSSLSKTYFSSSKGICEELLREPIHGKGVSIILSDFLLEEGVESLEKVLSYLRYKKQHIILVQILCKEEQEPEDVGDFEFIDSESGKRVRLNLTPKMIEAYKKRLQDYRNQLEALVLKYNAKMVTVSAESDIETIILKDFYEKQIVF
ncbi:MAG: DUF58 domain-containing protein [Cellulosilyticum sp.]|nr:DUF58 domain-containing protein [Cellulosilyticum sp.]